MLVVQLDAFTVGGSVNLAVVPVAYVLGDETWTEESVFERKRFSSMTLDVDVPVLVTRTGISDIDTLVAALTHDLASDTPDEQVSITDTGTLEPYP